MKKLAKVSALFVAGLMLFAFTTNKAGENSFEGVITFTFNMEGGDNPQAAQMFQGSTIKTYIKGNMSKTESNMGMMKTTTIVDRSKPDATVMLMEMMGNKYQLKIDDKMKKEAADESKVDIKYLSGTKTVAGYDCKEAQMQIKDRKSGESYTSDIYYTDKLPYNNEYVGSQFKGLKGIPLSYTVQTHGMTITIAAQSITPQSVPDSVFAIPAGYSLMTSDDMQKDMMSKMGGGH
jgi:hypothetical protein